MRDNSIRACESLRSVLVRGSSIRRLVLFMGTPSSSTMTDRDQCAERSSACARAMCSELVALDEGIELMPQSIATAIARLHTCQTLQVSSLARGSTVVAHRGRGSDGGCLRLSGRARPSEAAVVADLRRLGVFRVPWTHFLEVMAPQSGHRQIAACGRECEIADRMRRTALAAFRTTPRCALPRRIRRGSNERCSERQACRNLAEKLAKNRSCSTQPAATLVAKGPGFESYSVACSSALAIRCEFGNCRVLQ